MKLLAVLFLAVAVSAAPKFRFSPRSQIGGANSPVILDNSAFLAGAISQVAVVCSGGTVSLTLTNSASIPDGDAQIIIGGTCDSTRSPVPVDGLVYGTDADTLCGRTGDSNVYTWSVEVREWYRRASGIELGPLAATFTVQCANDPIQPTEIPAFSQPPVVPEGNAEFTGTVEFSLQISAASTDRQWVLELEPTSIAALRGLSYTINDLVASTDNGAGPRLSADLIDNGCIQDRLGVQVTQGLNEDQRSTIRVTAFQFTARPGSQIDFTATVRLCTPSAPGEVCAPVKSVAECNGLPEPETTAAAPMEVTTEEVVDLETSEPEPTIEVVEPEVTTEEVPIIPEEPEVPTPEVPEEPEVPVPEGRRIRRSPSKRSAVPLGTMTVKVAH